MRKTATKRFPHVIWVCGNSKPFYRAKGDINCRPGSVVPKLVESGIKVNVLIPFDSSLLPKTKLAPGRSTRHTLRLAKNHHVDIIKLTRGNVQPGIFMAKLPPLRPGVQEAVYAKAALALARQLRKPVDIFHVFEWEAGLFPLFLELERKTSSVFADARTFLNIHSLKETGNFSSDLLDELGIPKQLFHPDGVEFYGRVNFLKAGLLFSDGVGMVESSRVFHRNGSGFDGILDSVMYKLRRWVSDRSFKTHLEAYEELMSLPRPKPLLPALLAKKVHATEEAAVTYIQSWGPPLPDRYQKDYMGFLVQSPVKAYMFWEWHDNNREFGVLLEDLTHARRVLLGRGLGSVGEFWIDAQPDGVYAVELVGWTPDGRMETLMRSAVVRTPRDRPSPNTLATFIDVRTKRRFHVTGAGAWDDPTRGWRGSSFEWISSLPPLRSLSSFVMPGSRP